MNLLYTIKQRLEKSNHDELLKTLNYHNLKAGQKTLQKFLDTDDIYLFLKNGSFDFKYNSEEFLRALFKALDLTSEGEDELKQGNHRLNAIRSMKNAPFIFVNTYIKRENQPIGKKNIKIDKERFVFLSKSEIIKIVGNIIKEHYLSSKGEIPMWGPVYNYVYHSPDGKKFTFDTNGILLQGHIEIMESRAELKIGNQKLT